MVRLSRLRLETRILILYVRIALPLHLNLYLLVCDNIPAIKVFGDRGRLAACIVV